MILKGKVHKFGNDVNTDEIIPARYLNTSDPKELGRHCMDGIQPGFAARVKTGDVIVAGKNFGCGSSREHAPLAIQACGISCVIAESFARIFYRNAVNIGLPILECQQAGRIPDNSLVEIDLVKGVIKDIVKNKIYTTQKFPQFLRELIKAGGLMQWVRKKATKSR